MKTLSMNDAAMSGTKSKSKTARGLRTALLLVATTGAVAPIFGCAAILGLEERTEEEALQGVLDEETDTRTTPLCVDYCDTVMENCAGENAVYTGRSSCINTCNALPPGEDTEPMGNTVECRLRRAEGAKTLPEEECAAAGPGGGTTCGNNCQAWCHLLESECPEDYAALAECDAACGAIPDPDPGGFSLTSYEAEEDTIQCRIVHLGAVAGDSVHCEHARFNPAASCVPVTSGPPTCAQYCDTIMATCSSEDFAVYEARDDCLAACEAFPLGDLANRTENTVGCRVYHANSAAQDPAAHCDHAGPTGDGHCGVETEEGQTGNCDSYCMLFQAGCADEFTAEFSDLAECSQACVVAMDGKGAANDTFYTVQTATEEDSLQCRVHYAVKAAAGESGACASAALSATCE